MLTQSITVNGLGAVVSWPPSLTGSGTTRSWTSRLHFNYNLVGSTWGNLVVNNFTTSVIANQGAEIAVPGRTYRPNAHNRINAFNW